MTLPAKANGSLAASERLEDISEQLEAVNASLAGLGAFDFKGVLEDGRLALRSINSARLSERLTRIEHAQRELGQCLGKTQFIEARLALVEEALAQILAEQRKPWWKKVFQA